MTKRWVFVNYPALAEENDPLGRAPGEPLWPSRFDKEYLLRRRLEMGARGFTALYLGRPSAAGGAIFKRDWFRYYTEPPSSCLKRIQVWDTAFGTKTANDFSVCLTFEETRNGIYLRSMWRGRVEFPELRRQVAVEAEMWKPHEIRVENKSSGISLLQEFKSVTTFPIVAVAVDADKETRANSITAFFESGRVLFPTGTAWVSVVEDELCSFPGAHDDIVDCFSMGLDYFRSRGGVLGLLEYEQGLVTGKYPETRNFDALARESRLRNLGRMAKNFFLGPGFTWPTSGDSTESNTVLDSSEYSQAYPPVASKSTFPPCPLCSSSSVTQVGNQLRCNACGAQFTAAKGSVQITVQPPKPCCERPLPRVIAGGQMRCQSCGFQSWPQGARPAIAAGPRTRAAYASGPDPTDWRVILRNGR